MKRAVVFSCSFFCFFVKSKKFKTRKKVVWALGSHYPAQGGGSVAVRRVHCIWWLTTSGCGCPHSLKLGFGDVCCWGVLQLWGVGARSLGGSRLPLVQCVERSHCSPTVTVAEAVLNKVRRQRGTKATRCERSPGEPSLALVVPKHCTAFMVKQEGGGKPATPHHSQTPGGGVVCGLGLQRTARGVNGSG